MTVQHTGRHSAKGTTPKTFTVASVFTRARITLPVTSLHLSACKALSRLLLTSLCIFFSMQWAAQAQSPTVTTDEIQSDTTHQGAIQKSAQHMSVVEAMTAVASRPELTLTFPEDYVALNPQQIQQIEVWATPFVKAPLPITVISYAALRRGYGDGSERLARHEAIRIGFKRALAVQETLTQMGVPIKNVSLHAPGPATSGYAERIVIYPRKIPFQ
ncbi:MAG: hypothetical protein CMF31_03245 [Kordiimonas sp.]|nr:hypothetical protein [Kordiimonas sp.]